jgi:hypothetical protein
LYENTPNIKEADKESQSDREIVSQRGRDRERKSGEKKEKKKKKN